MPKMTIRLNGQVLIQFDGEAAEFAALLARYSEEGLRITREEFGRPVNEEPERFVALALTCDTHDPERPGKVFDWLLPGWKFDIDYRSVQDGIDIVVTVFEPKRRN